MLENLLLSYPYTHNFLINFLFLCPVFLISFEDTLEFRSGYFHFASHTAKKIYGNGSTDIEVENIFKINSFCSIWANFNYCWKEGLSLSIENKTRLYFYTWSLGPKLFLSVIHSYVDLYIGVGPTISYVHVRDYTNYLPPTTNRASVGCVGKLGLLIYPYKRLALDVFFDYYYQPVHTRKSSTVTQSYLNLGGFRTGAGIGYIF